MRKERAGGDLAVELRGPAAGDLAGAARAAAFRSQTVLFDVISVTPNQSFTALRAARVFPVPNHAGEVSDINVAKAGGLTDFGSLQ